MSCFGVFHGQKQYLSHILFWGTQHVQQWRAHSAVHNVMCFLFLFFAASWLFCLKAIIQDTAITNPAFLT